MQLDKKEKQMLQHYNKLFESFIFDEYDVLGFLMLIREHIRKDKRYPCILEFADLIAHRERDRGQVLGAIKVAINNNYETYDGKHVKGYNGIDEARWKSEWNIILTELNISANKRLLDEITICICSLANGSKYSDRDSDNIRPVGILYLGFSKNKIALITTEGGSTSLHISFFVYSGLEFNVDKKYSFGEWITETVRENGILKMKDESGNYIF